jgi:hypothetical protein
MVFESDAISAPLDPSDPLDLNRDAADIFLRENAAVAGTPTWANLPRADEVLDSVNRLAEPPGNFSDGRFDGNGGYHDRSSSCATRYPVPFAPNR